MGTGLVVELDATGWAASVPHGLPVEMLVAFPWGTIAFGPLGAGPGLGRLLPTVEGAGRWNSASVCFAGLGFLVALGSSPLDDCGSFRSSTAKALRSALDRESEKWVRWVLHL